MAYSTYIKQASANQLVLPFEYDAAEYDYITFGFYQNGRCIAMYTSEDDEYVDLSNDGEVRIYMLASVSKRFGSQRVSYEVTAWQDSTSSLLISDTLTVETYISQDRQSIVDEDDTEITDGRLRAQIERMAAHYIPINIEQATTYLQEQITALEARVSALEGE